MCQPEGFRSSALRRSSGASQEAPDPEPLSPLRDPGGAASEPPPRARASPQRRGPRARRRRRHRLRQRPSRSSLDPVDHDLRAAERRPPPPHDAAARKVTRLPASLVVVPASRFPPSLASPASFGAGPPGHECALAVSPALFLCPKPELQRLGVRCNSTAEPNSRDHRVAPADGPHDDGHAGGGMSRHGTAMASQRKS